MDSDNISDEEEFSENLSKLEEAAKKSFQEAEDEEKSLNMTKIFGNGKFFQKQEDLTEQNQEMVLESSVGEVSAIFKCRFCTTDTFNSADDLREHVERVHERENPKLICDVCNSKLSNSSNLKKHIKDVHGKSYPCVLCDAILESKYFLDKHNFETHVTTTSYALNVTKD